MLPPLVQKDHPRWGEELLECPATSEPCTVPNLFPCGFPAVILLLKPEEIGEICVALLSLSVPSIHGIDGVGELSTAFLIDTTGINPDSLVSSLKRQGTTLVDLLENGMMLSLAVLEFLKADLFALCRYRKILRIPAFLHVTSASLALVD